MKIILYVLLQITLSAQDPTSIGRFSEGIEDTSTELSSFSTSLQTAFNKLFKESDESLFLSSETGVDLLESAKKSLQISLESVNDNIKDTEKKISMSYDVCSVLDSCYSCVANTNCIWCTALSMCIPGDSQGSYSVECSSWQYKKCQFGQCDAYNDCQSCLSTTSCSWCERGKDCISNSNTCKKTFLYTDVDSCPEYKQPVETEMDNDRYDDLVQNLTSLRQKSAEIINMIENLDRAENSMLQVALAKANAPQNDFSIAADLAGLSDAVNELRTAETTKDENSETRLVEDTESEVINYMEDEEDQKTQDEFDDIDTQYSKLSGDVNSMETQIGASLKSVATSISIINQSIHNNKQKNN